MHDLRRTLDDLVDAHIAQRPLDSPALDPAFFKRVGGFVTGTRADLQGLISNPGTVRRAEILGDRRLEADILVLVVGHERRHPCHRVHCKRVSGHVGELQRNAFMMTDRRSPLHALLRPLAADVQAPLANPNGGRRQRQPPGIERGERKLQSLPLADNDILFWHFQIVETDQSDLNAVQAHEDTAIDDLKAGRVGLDDKCGDLLALLALDDLRRRDRHDRDHVGDQAISAPELLAV